MVVKILPAVASAGTSFLARTVGISFYHDSSIIIAGHTVHVVRHCNHLLPPHKLHVVAVVASFSSHHQCSHQVTLYPHTRPTPCLSSHPVIFEEERLR